MKCLRAGERVFRHGAPLALTPVGSRVVTTRPLVSLFATFQRRSNIRQPANAAFSRRPSARVPGVPLVTRTGNWLGSHGGDVKSPGFQQPNSPSRASANGFEYGR